MERSLQMTRQYRYCIWLLCVCILGTFLYGCAQNTSKGSYLKNPVSYRTDLFDGIYDNCLYRLPSNIQDICLILEEEKYNTELVDATAAGKFVIGEGEAVYAKNAFTPLPMASITKIMTALVALKYGNIDDVVAVGQEVVITYYDAWLLGLKPGDTLTLEDLLYITLLYSGNDAAAAVAAHVGGTVENFVQMMNEEAAALGATSTQFKNPHGLDADGHYTTIYDLYLIFSECLKYEEFKTIIGTLERTISYTDIEGNEKTVRIENSNLYMNGTVPVPTGITVFGGKTGFTFNAHRCLILYTKDSNNQYSICIVLGSENQNTLYDEMGKLVVSDSSFLKSDLVE